MAHISYDAHTLASPACMDTGTGARAPLNPYKYFIFHLITAYKVLHSNSCAVIA